MVVATNIDVNELLRYFAYLQRQLVTEGTETWFEHERFRQAVNARKLTFGESIPAEMRADLVEEYVHLINSFQPSMPYDSASATAIFTPLIQRIEEAAQRTGFRTLRMLKLVTSPAITATPHTISTEASHVIFVGPGTFTFCNYWAKIFTSLLGGVPISKRGRWSFPLTINAIVDASRLAIYHATAGTVMGFGVMPSDPNKLTFRMEYVEAMELFALGHEFGHCVAHDAEDRYHGMLSEEIQHELELLCDRIGISTSRAASTDGSWAAFCGAGAVLLMYAHEIYQRAVAHIATASPSETSGYPATKARVATIREQVTSTTPGDQLEGVVSYLDGVIALCDELTDAVSEITAQVLR